MATTRPLKRGDTFRRLYRVDAATEDGFFIGWTLRGEVRNAGGKVVAEIDAYWGPPVEETRFLIIEATDTNDWPLGRMEADVRFTRTADGEKISTEGILFNVIEGQDNSPEGGA